MLRLKRTLAWCCVFVFIISVPQVQAVPDISGQHPGNQMEQPSSPWSSYVKLSAGAAVLMDVATGDVLYDKQAHKKRPPASTTKIMTGILGLELGRPEEVVTVSSKAGNVGQATIHLDPGEKITLFELITGALVRSGNDACVAIAEHIAGSEEQFVQLMNQKALTIGAQNTNFVNTNGLPAKNHYSTAYDLALMARYGLQIPEFASITRLRETEIHFVEPDILMDLRNTNKLLWNYSYADGVKTGTTVAAGKCLVASATKDGRQLVTVVLNAPDRFGDAQKLLEWGFQNTERIELAGAGTVMGEFPLASTQVIRAVLETPLELSIPKREREKVVGRIIWERGPDLPIKKGERLGRYELWVGEYKLKSVPLVSEQEVSQPGVWDKILGHWPLN